jgi:hypothetical protein
MSHFLPRNGRFALTFVVLCLLLALPAIRPAAGLQSKQTAPITPVKVTPAPIGIDTSIMSAGARPGNSGSSIPSLTTLSIKLSPFTPEQRIRLLTLIVDDLVTNFSPNFPKDLSNQLLQIKPTLDAIPPPATPVVLSSLGVSSLSGSQGGFKESDIVQLLQLITLILPDIPEGKSPITPQLSHQFLQSIEPTLKPLAAAFAAHGPTDPIVRNGQLVIPGAYPASLYLGAQSYGEPRTGNGLGRQTLGVPDLKFSDALTGLDLDFQQFENDENGTAGAIQYAFGPARAHYSDALASAIGFNGIQQRSASYKGLTPDNLDAMEAADPTLAAAVAQSETLETRLGDTLVRYTHSLQMSVYITGLSYTGRGTYTSEGGAVGQLFPIGSTGLTVSGIAQAIQFSPSGGSGMSYGSDVQYGGSIVWQDRISSLDMTEPNNPLPIIRPWIVKVGADYFSKTLGGYDTLPSSWEAYIRYKFPVGTKHHPLDLELRPFYGESGEELPNQRRQELVGGDIGITVPISL